MIATNTETRVVAAQTKAKFARVGVSEELARETKNWTVKPPDPPVVEPKPEPQSAPRSVRYRWD